MAKYHLSKSGTVGLCKATKTACPLGGDAPHAEFDNFEDAQAWAETELASQYGTDKLAGLSKKPAVDGRPFFEGAETIVPEPKYGKEAMVVAPSTLAKDDVIFDSEDEELGVVTEVKVGTKNVTVTIQPDESKARKITFSKSDPGITVDRRVETALSKAAREKAIYEGSYERIYKNFKRSSPEVLAKLSETVEKGYALNGHDVSQLIEADAKDNVRMGFNRHVENIKAAADRGEIHYSPNRGLYTHAYETYKERLTKEVLSDAAHVTSVSTSESSNLQRRALLEAKADFIEHFYPW